MNKMAMDQDAEMTRQWHEDEERWWNDHGEYMTLQWKLTPKLSEQIRGAMERDYKSFLLYPGERLLDLGCGSGWLSAYFADRGMNVLGVDISSEQIDAANRLKAGYPGAKLEFECCDFMKWDVERYRSNFSSMFVSAFLHHLPEHELALVLEKIALMVKPGGRVYLYEPMQCGRQRTFLIKVIDRFYNLFMQLWLDTFPRWFGWWSERHLAELKRGYTMSSPHEAPVMLEHLNEHCGQNFEISETRGWHLNSLGFGMQSMGLKESVRSWYAPLTCLLYAVDQLLFRCFGWQAFSTPGRFILCSVKMTRK